MTTACNFLTNGLRLKMIDELSENLTGRRPVVIVKLTQALKEMDKIDVLMTPTVVYHFHSEVATFVIKLISFINAPKII